MPFTKVASAEDLWDGEMLACTVEGTRLLLVKMKGTVTAFEDRCAHLGVPLSKGSLEGHVLTCGVHLWQYDVRTGNGINPRNACLKAFAAKVVAGDVLVDIGECRRAPIPDITEASPQMSNADTDLYDHVGPIFEAGATSRAVIVAIQKLNQDVRVQDRGSYLRVLSPRSCIVTRSAIEAELGRPFRLPGDLELLMPSFKGVFAVTDDVASWTWKGAR